MAEHPNVTRLREGYDAFASGDLAAAMSSWHPDIVWHVPGATPLSGTYKGHAEVAGFFQKLQELAEGTFKLEVHDVLANDDQPSRSCTSPRSARGGPSTRTWLTSSTWTKTGWPPSTGAWPTR